MTQKERNIKREADFLLDTECTIRQVASAFGISKSTIHKDVTERLREIDFEEYLCVRKVLDRNFEEKNMRGGLATKEKYKKLKGN